MIKLFSLALLIALWAFGILGEKSFAFPGKTDEQKNRRPVFTTPRPDPSDELAMRRWENARRAAVASAQADGETNLIEDATTGNLYIDESANPINEKSIPSLGSGHANLTTKIFRMLLERHGVLNLVSELNFDWEKNQITLFTKTQEAVKQVLDPLQMELSQMRQPFQYRVLFDPLHCSKNLE